MLDNLYQIESPHFTAGFILDSDGSVVRAAKIIKYMEGWSLNRVKAYCHKKGWRIR